MTLVNISDVVYNPDGSLFNGLLLVTISTTINEGDIVTAFVGTYPVANGVVKLSLFPNTGNPAVTYQFQFQGSGNTVLTCDFPANAPNPTTLAPYSVPGPSVTPILGTLLLSQLSQGGATNGQLLAWNSTAGAWQPVSAAAAYFAAQSQPARNVGTTYQNSTGKPVFVVVTVSSLAGTCSFSELSDSNASPSTIVGTITLGSGLSGQISMMVLPGNYYKVSLASGSGLATVWTEWN